MAMYKIANFAELGNEATPRILWDTSSIQHRINNQSSISTAWCGTVGEHTLNRILYTITSKQTAHRNRNHFPTIFSVLSSNHFTAVTISILFCEQISAKSVSEMETFSNHFQRLPIILLQLQLVYCTVNKFPRNLQYSETRQGS